MENQHKFITGYRDLDKSEIDAMNKIKELANTVGNEITTLANKGDLDERWLEAGLLTLQTGFMQVTRAVAKPTSF